MRRLLRLVGIALLLATSTLLLAASPLLAQSIMERLVTPGALSAPHGNLAAHCDACHSSFRKEAQNAKCLACHKPVGADVANRTGFHGRFAPARSGSCNSCHGEHKGAGFALVRLESAHFNHGLADFQLTGGHVRVACAQCHAGMRHFAAAPGTCAACHAKIDPHRGAMGGGLGRECQSCHTTAGWKQTLPFDHARTGFALTGGHRGAACLTCHVGQKWHGVATACVSCHARNDVHKGANGSNCAQCHTTASWKSASFDHGTTGFPLVGGHAAATCGGCHGANQATRHPTRDCNGCHAKSDVHKGANGPQCAQCHTPRNWKQIVFDHDRLTTFVLRGAHDHAACAACHVKPARAVKLPVACNACHARDDVHKGANGSDCARCHNETAWKVSHFDHARMTSFALLGKHAQIACAACHTQPADKVKLPNQCGACHAVADVHKGRLGQACGDCHDAASWTAPVRFDHGLTVFPLLGKHAPLACATCHADRTFAAKGKTCAACHADDHHQGSLGTPSACADCHNVNGWKGWAYDHDRQTRFALTGAHKGLICSACHRRAGDPAKTGQQCLDCHQRDDIHRGGFGDDCARCHTTTSFRRGQGAP